MEILIQIIDNSGDPIGEPIQRDWEEFIKVNDGFENSDHDEMYSTIWGGGSVKLGNHVITRQFDLTTYKIWLATPDRL